MSLTASGDGVTITNASTTQGPFTLLGGRYALTAHGTWSSGSATLQLLAPDGVTYVNVASFTSDGSATVSLPAGKYQVAVSGASGVYVSITKILQPAATKADLTRGVLAAVFGSC
jgi:hypothetical protein